MNLRERSSALVDTSCVGRGDLVVTVALVGTLRNEEAPGTLWVPGASSSEVLGEPTAKRPPATQNTTAANWTSQRRMTKGGAEGHGAWGQHSQSSSSVKQCQAVESRNLHRGVPVPEVAGARSKHGYLGVLVLLAAFWRSAGPRACGAGRAG